LFVLFINLDARNLLSGPLARVGEKTNACQVTVGTSKNPLLGRSSSKYENATEMELKNYDVMVWGGRNILCPLHVGNFLSM